MRALVFTVAIATMLSAAPAFACKGLVYCRAADTMLGSYDPSSGPGPVLTIDEDRFRLTGGLFPVQFPYTLNGAGDTGVLASIPNAMMSNGGPDTIRVVLTADGVRIELFSALIGTWIRRR